MKKQEVIDLASRRGLCVYEQYKGRKVYYKVQVGSSMLPCSPSINKVYVPSLCWMMYALSSVSSETVT